MTDFHCGHHPDGHHNHPRHHYQYRTVIPGGTDLETPQQNANRSEGLVVCLILSGLFTITAGVVLTSIDNKSTFLAGIVAIFMGFFLVLIAHCVCACRRTQRVSITYVVHLLAIYQLHEGRKCQVKNTLK